MHRHRARVDPRHQGGEGVAGTPGACPRMHRRLWINIVVVYHRPHHHHHHHHLRSHFGSRVGNCRGNFWRLGSASRAVVFKAQHPSQVFVSVIRVVVRDGSHLVVFLRVLSWSRLLAECEIRYLVAAFVALSCVWFWSRLWAEHEIRFCGVHPCGREASCSINVVCCRMCSAMLA